MSLTNHFTLIGVVIVAIAVVELIQTKFNREKERLGWLMLLVTALIIIWLSGCTVISPRKVALKDWPIKQVNVYAVDYEVVSDICQCYSPPLMVAQACTLLYFNQGKAEIWLTDGAPEWIVEHEKQHAFGGHDHLLSTDIEQAFRAWRDGSVSGGDCPMPAKIDEYRRRPFTVEYSYERLDPATLHK